MTREKIRIRYDGLALENHSIDIDDLAPALLAIGELCKLANRKFNGNRATVKVLIIVNLDQNCFEFNLELVQSIISKVTLLVGDEKVATAKELLEWLGLIGSGTKVSAVGLFKFYKFLKCRTIESSQIVEENGKDVIRVNIEGDNNNVSIHPQTFDLNQDPKTIKFVQKTLKPLSKDGYEKMEFESENGQVEEITQEEAKQILDITFDEQLNLETLIGPQIITVWLKVYSPVYKVDAKNWQFEFFEKIAWVDISETDIAQKTIERGGAFVDDIYKVRLEIIQAQTSDGNLSSRYKIKEVIEFQPSTLMQPSLIENGANEKWQQ